jgi:hypothetical protein
MADRVLTISWGESVRGREERGLEVFNEAIGLYGRMQQDGRIESFDVTLCAPNGGVEGYMQLHGTADQLAAVREADDFRSMIMDATLIVDHLKMLDGVTGEGLAKEIARYQEAIAKVPQTA